MKNSYVYLILCIGCLVSTGCKKQISVPDSEAEIQALPSKLPKYTHKEFNKTAPQRFAMAKRINSKYRVGPRLRFDSYLDDVAEQYFPCWDEGTTALVDPQASLCSANIYEDEFCKCESGPEGTFGRDCVCKYPESNSAEKKAINAAVQSASKVTQLAKSNGFAFTVHPLELYLVFLAEAGFRPLSANQFNEIDGYEYLGVDNLSESPTKPLRAKYEPWAPTELKQWLKNGAQIKKCTNELNEACFTPSNFNIQNGMDAVATEYAFYKAYADKQIFAATGKHIQSLPRRGQLFWAYIHFNAGEPATLSTTKNPIRLTPSTLARYDSPVAKEDNYAKNLMSATFNASVRTSTYVYWSELCQKGIWISKKLCADPYL